MLPKFVAALKAEPHFQYDDARQILDLLTRASIVVLFVADAIGLSMQIVWEPLRRAAADPAAAFPPTDDGARAMLMGLTLMLLAYAAVERGLYRRLKVKLGAA